MSEEVKYPRQELDYSDISPGSGKMCKTCQNYDQPTSTCNIMSKDDNHVQETGYCKKYEAGKQVLYDFWRGRKFRFGG